MVAATRRIARRLRDALRREGPAAVAAAGLRRARQELRRCTLVHERHVWYGLDLTRPYPRRPLPAGLELRRATEADLWLLDGLPTFRPARGRRLLAEGTEIWLVVESGRAVFLCLAYRRRPPVAAAPGGTIDLPDGMVVLEDQVTAPDQRGRGLSPAALPLLAEQAAAGGATSLAAKIEESNVASRRAVVKAGFREVARMEYRRRGPWRRLVARVEEPGVGDALVDRLRQGAVDS